MAARLRGQQIGTKKNTPRTIHSPIREDDRSDENTPSGKEENEEDVQRLDLRRAKGRRIARVHGLCLRRIRRDVRYLRELCGFGDSARPSLASMGRVCMGPEAR